MMIIIGIAQSCQIKSSMLINKPIVEEEELMPEDQCLDMVGSIIKAFIPNRYKQMR
jgi:hypothetical protein